MLDQTACRGDFLRIQFCERGSVRFATLAGPETRFSRLITG